ncbi:MAG TPA: MMPL family transporter, partial [Acidimicrobiia bacterium]|nr:MMPL family transporter [Acidimicrobiia bacterium]
MGICVGVFQGLLGQPGLAFWLPPFLFVILVALGADYNIFIAGRIREEIDAGRTVADAATESLVLTGGTITSAGFILAGTFGALLITPIPAVRQIGFGIGAGVLLDTFIVRTLLVPAAVMLLGRSAFWPSTAPATNPGRRRIAVGFSGAGIVLLAVALAAVGLSGRPESPVLRVAATGHPSAPAAGAAGVSTTTAATAAPDQTAASAPAATHPATTGPVRVSPSAAQPTSATTPAPAASALPATTTTTGTAPPANPPASGAQRVAIPTLGDWRYHVVGTRRIGLAGSTQPFNEEDTTQVSRVGGDDQTPELRLLTQSSSGTIDERRRYAPAAVDLLSLQVASGGLSYGGTFSPPQLLLRWPVRIGDRWTSDWTTNDTKGTTTATVTGERTVTVASRALHCYVVERNTTLTGAIEGTQRQRSCWAPDLGMIIDDDQNFTGTYQGVHFEGQAHFTLTGIPT